MNITSKQSILEDLHCGINNVPDWENKTYKAQHTLHSYPRNSNYRAVVMSTYKTFEVEFRHIL